MTILVISGFLLVFAMIGWVIWRCTHKKEDYFQFEEDKNVKSGKIEIAKIEEILPQVPERLNGHSKSKSNSVSSGGSPSKLKRMLNNEGLKRQFSKQRTLSPERFGDANNSGNPDHEATGKSISMFSNE